MEKTNQTVALETKTEQVQETKPQIRKPKITGAGVKNFMCNRVLPGLVGAGLTVLAFAIAGGKDRGGDSNDDDYTIN